MFASLCDVIVPSVAATLVVAMMLPSQEFRDITINGAISQLYQELSHPLKSGVGGRTDGGGSMGAKVRNNKIPARKISHAFVRSAVAAKDKQRAEPSVFNVLGPWAHVQ